MVLLRVMKTEKSSTENWKSLKLMLKRELVVKVAVRPDQHVRLTHVSHLVEQDHFPYFDQEDCHPHLYSLQREESLSLTHRS